MSNLASLNWQKSSYSGTAGDNCIEVAFTERTIQVRDSKDMSRPNFTVSRSGWAVFVQHAARI
ncbi:DUF397 domain-containing protein [Streptomyces albipurpureus]|uniref:DUF397 domain-containing protein n=1 Tax=Streptomyces albipurpureus TaxID=2897419 RepID=A0ABT0UI64_9ACTN|nr:DUF397 domain-containing protein [Streptomyces sp. CWNU-1]MCM2387310.1 DUF397 domain-containing protein [Streptomyces sp. CWNU-1]